MLINVTDIKWDTDGEEVDLPDEEQINLDISNESDWDEIEEEIGNYLSDTYGFCHDGFTYNVIDS